MNDFFDLKGEWLFDLEEKKEREREFTREVRFNSEVRKLFRQKTK